MQIEQPRGAKRKKNESSAAVFFFFLSDEKQMEQEGTMSTFNTQKKRNNFDQ